MFTDVLQGNRSGRFFSRNEMERGSCLELTWNWATLSRRGTISRRCWRWKLKEVLRRLAEMGAGDCGQRLKAECPGVDAVFYQRDA